ncbi:hypothetical protein KIL84_011533 [Mauremys mutica]|uniref:Uncharacterized protein n=1 Tax=Mauremys mutica TaxID=74926 RepID=A0A9D3XDT8_9SAUR|nr:hypothetical protein KIL84_011533 [Mauremys mutica]
MSKEGFWDMPTKAGVACLCALTCSVCTEEAVALKSGSCSFASRLLPFRDAYPCLSADVTMHRVSCLYAKERTKLMLTKASKRASAVPAHLENTSPCKCSSPIPILVATLLQ